MQLSTNAVSALRKVWVQTRLWKQQSAEAHTYITAFNVKKNGVQPKLHAVKCSADCMQCQEELGAAPTACNVKKSRVQPKL